MAADGRSRLRSAIAAADPAIAAMRQIAASTLAMEELMLEIAPAYPSDTQAAERLAPLCDEIGKYPDHGLAARRYALSDRRALQGTVL